MPSQMPKDTAEQLLVLAFKGKDKMSQAMDDALWDELFEVLNLFSKKE